MKAWRVNEWCEPEQMELAETPVPEPGPNEVRIRNRAAALNFYDILMIQGKYQVRPPLPFTPGTEVAGTVDAVGAEVTGFAVGDRVQAIASTGGYAEYSIAPTGKTFRIPDAMSFDEAAAMIVVYQTSYFALKQRAELKPGEWLLVHAAAGGVGLSAMQIGKAMGARVIATAGSAEKLDFCLSQGAEHALNYREATWVDAVKKITGGRGADVIYDPVGGEVFDLSTKVIAPEGRLLVIGFAGGTIPSIAANRILLKDMSVVGVFWGGYCERHPDYLHETQADLFAMYEAGQIRPVVSQAYPLAEAPAALRALAGRKTWGKVVLTVG
ncbi:MAG TPA: NADPH:quinone oxidoreductase family protein [Blastocatellia bacterium]|nr:NADPH:quinone oxidoreductase family protein [Blastocatellia bacterium]